MYPKCVTMLIDVKINIPVSLLSSLSDKTEDKLRQMITDKFGKSVFDDKGNVLWNQGKKVMDYLISSKLDPEIPEFQDVLEFQDVRHYYLVQVQARSNTSPLCVMSSDDQMYNGVLDWYFYNLDDAIKAFDKLKKLQGGVHATAVITADTFEPVITSHGLDNYKMWKHLIEKQCRWKNKYRNM